jgi:hypothetical protein
MFTLLMTFEKTRKQCEEFILSLPKKEQKELAICLFIYDICVKDKKYNKETLLYTLDTHEKRMEFYVNYSFQ